MSLIYVDHIYYGIILIQYIFSSVVLMSVNYCVNFVTGFKLNFLQNQSMMLVFNIQELFVFISFLSV